MNELRRLLLDTANKIFGDFATRDLLGKAELGEFPAALWQALREAGLTGALLPEEWGGPGLALPDALSLLRPAARYSAPVPLAETWLASWLLTGAGLAPPADCLTVAPVRLGDVITGRREGTGWRLSGVAGRVPWARGAGAIIALIEGEGEPMVAILQPEEVRITGGKNLAGEPRDEVVFDTLLASDRVAPSRRGRMELHALGAVLRAVAMAGALDHCLDLAVRYAQDRVQFGRPIGKFQAVQQNLAVLAGQASAAQGAADMAIESLEPMNLLAIAAAKARCGEAAGAGAAIAHQVHGAIGFTHEHELHFSTRRLWSWREEFGNETEWSLWIGRQIAGVGADGLWPLITSV